VANNQNDMKVELWSLDVDNNSVPNVQTCTIDWGTISPTINVNDTRFGFQCWLSKYGDELFLHVLTLCRSDYNPSDTKFGIYTFKVDANDNTKLTAVNFFDVGRKVYGFMPLTLDKNKAILFVPGDALSINFDGTQWNSLSMGVGEVKVSLYDTSGRLWILNYDNKLYMLTPTIPIEPKMWTEPEEVNYDGTTQTVKLKIDTFNMYGERISVSGKLIIQYGDAEFEGGAKVKEITTSATGTTEVDVFVKGTADSKIDFVIEL
jgi:hypothetical protein